LWFDQNFEIIDELCAPLITIHSPLKKTIGRCEKKNIAYSWLNAFSNQRSRIENIVESSGIIQLKWSCLSTNINSFGDLTPIYQDLEYGGVCYYRLNDQNQITEYFSISNVLSELTKHGALPNLFSKPFAYSAKQEGLLPIKNINDVLLTKREIHILGLWLKGFTAKESARILNISARTVEEHRYNIKDKFSVQYKSQLIRIIRDKGIMDYFLNLPDLPMKS
jgi:DNA-binding CsgD family transcriptional regulator